MEQIKRILYEYNITEIGYTSNDTFRLVYPHLLPKHPVSGAIMFLLPYKYSPAYNDGINISKYACARDYHFFIKNISQDIVTKLTELMPNEIFSMFCDTSPIDERLAAAYANLGVIGMNNMLINKTYGSYCFIGSILTTYTPKDKKNEPIKYCIKCGNCQKACPTKALGNDMSHCLSLISQSKRKTTDKNNKLINSHTVWGCDVCQDVCPMNSNASDTPIVFFKQNIISTLSLETIDKMTNDEFSQRAYAWRGKKVIIDNLKLFESK